MNLLKDKNELALEFPKLTIYRPKFYSLKYNDKITYECGCKNSHRLNDESGFSVFYGKTRCKFSFFMPKKFLHHGFSKRFL